MINSNVCKDTFFSGIISCRPAISLGNQRGTWVLQSRGNNWIRLSGCDAKNGAEDGVVFIKIIGKKDAKFKTICYFCIAKGREPASVRLPVGNECL